MKKSSAYDLMVIVAWMYYEDGLTQEEIANQLKISRVSISRILQSAQKENIVKIQITQPRPLLLELSLKLKEKFGLEKSIIVPNSDNSLESVGKAAAEYLEEAVNNYHHIGVGWSSTLSYLTPYLPRYASPVNCKVNELAGNMLHEQNPYSISPYLVQSFGVSLESLPVPAIVENDEVRETFLKEPSIVKALDSAKKVEIAFVGLGEATTTNTMVRTGHLAESEIEEIREKNGVGEVLLHFFDQNGNHIDSSLESRLISIDWESLIHIPQLVLVAVGSKKVEAIVGALRGNLIHCLITDSETAKEVLLASEE